MDVQTTPTPPDAWLSVLSYSNGQKHVSAIMTVPDDPQVAFWQQFAEQANRDPARDADFQATLVVIKDDSSLAVNVGQIWISNPVHLAVRDNWFRRFKKILAKHLTEPRPTRVFTFPVGTPINPRKPYKSSVREPFAWTTGRALPKCKLCGAPMACIGVLDFRECSFVQSPNGWFVVHGCQQCGAYDSEARSWNWIMPGEDVKFVGESTSVKALIGTVWETTDFPTPCTYAKEISDDSIFLLERRIDFNFSCFADKIGGYPCWVQGDWTPCDSEGNPMSFIGQLTSAFENHVGYVFYSNKTNETEIVIQGL